MNAYPEEDYKKTLEALQIDKKPHLYLEQSTNKAFPDLDELNDDKCFVQIRFWNKEQRRSNTVRDFVFPKTMLVSDLKKLLSEKYIPNLKPEDMLLFEEETEKTFNYMKEDNKTLSHCGIISGDIIHIEAKTDEHNVANGPRAFTNKYFEEKLNKIKCYHN